VIQLPLRYDEAAYVAAHLRRLTTWNQRAVVRLQLSGETLGVFGSPPFDCVSFIAVPLAEPLDDPVELDTMVSAGRLRDVIGDVSARSQVLRLVTVPDEVAPIAELAVLPPRAPWLPADRGLAGDVRPMVAAAVQEFTTRSAGVTQQLVLQSLADEIWSRPGWGGLPMRSLHAAQSLGLLAHDGLRIQTATCQGWKKFSAPSGQIFVRNSGLPPVLNLAVLN
jgi:hypothetical protein